MAGLICGYGEEIPDGADGGATFADEASDVTLVHGEHEDGLVTLLTMIQMNIVRVFDELPHHMVQKPVEFLHEKRN